MLRNLIVAIALLSAAVTAHAGLVAAIPESATVTLLFISLATVALAARRRRGATVDAGQG